VTELLRYSAGLTVYIISTFCIVMAWRSLTERREYRMLPTAGPQTRFNPCTRDIEVVYDEMFEIPRSCL
jgi:hypothetical protein